MFRVGVITSTHGLAGEVKVFPTTDDPHRYDTLQDVILQSGRENIPLRINRHRYFKQYVIVGFEGLDRIEDVQRFVKKELYVTRENAVPLEEGEYYIPDLIGRIEEKLKNRMNACSIVPSGLQDTSILLGGVCVCIHHFLGVHYLSPNNTFTVG